MRRFLFLAAALLSLTIVSKANAVVIYDLALTGSVPGSGELQLSGPIDPAFQNLSPATLAPSRRSIQNHYRWTDVRPHEQLHQPSVHRWCLVECRRVCCSRRSRAADKRYDICLQLPNCCKCHWPNHRRPEGACRRSGARTCDLGDDDPWFRCAGRCSVSQALRACDDLRPQ